MTSIDDIKTDRQMTPAMRAVYRTMTYSMTAATVCHLLGKEGMKKNTVINALYTLKGWGLLMVTKKPRIAPGPLKNKSGPDRFYYRRAEQ